MKLRTGFNFRNKTKKGRWRGKLRALTPAGRHGISVAVIGRNLYVAGGGKGRGNHEVTNELLMFSMP
jgi:hypothetical protein